MLVSIAGHHRCTDGLDWPRSRRRSVLWSGAGQRHPVSRTAFGTAQLCEEAPPDTPGVFCFPGWRIRNRRQPGQRSSMWRWNEFRHRCGQRCCVRSRIRPAMWRSSGLVIKSLHSVNLILHVIRLCYKSFIYLCNTLIIFAYIVSTL